MNAAPCWIGYDGTDRIGSALAVKGGHLFVHEGGWTLYFSHGCRLSAYDADQIKTACSEAGLPIIDIRGLDPDTALSLACRLPMIAVGTAPDPEPWHALSYAPLSHIVELYRAVGAEITHAPVEPSA